jgi:RNA polymerase sigma-70 factor (ECF subfamily)
MRPRFSTWLFSIARNKCLNALKKGVPTPSDELPAPHDPATPADALERKELLERLDAALDSLPEEMKTAFVLTEFSGLSSEEVAEIQGVEPGTVRSRVSRARDRIREMCVPPP